MAEPKLRFMDKKGNSYPEWDKNTLLSVLSQPITDGPHETPILVEQGVDFISVDAIVDNKIDFSRKRGCISLEYNEQCNKKYKPQLHDVYLVKSGSTVGKVAVVETENTFNIWSPLAAMRTKNDYSPYFLYYYLQTSKVQKEIVEKSRGGTQPNLSMRTLEKVEVPIVSYEEQQKIADLLSSTDEVITLLTEEVRLWEEKKKGIMKKLFSQEIRFKDENGDNYPEWEEKKLSEVVEFLDKKRKPLTSGDRKPGPYPYYGASGIIDYVEDYLFDEELILLSEDGANIIDRNYRVAFIAKGKYWVNNHAHVLRAKNGNVNTFICEKLESINYEKYNTGTAQPKLNQEVCANLELDVPCLAEQQKIADCLTSIDEVIALKKQKLETWKYIKKGLLQQMFV